MESIYIDSTASCFGDINRQKESDVNQETDDNKSGKEEVLSRKESIRSRSVTSSWPNLTEENLKNITLSEDSISHSRNPSEIDSLDSNYVRKHYNFEAHLKGNFKDGSPESFRSSGTLNQDNQIYYNPVEQEIQFERQDISIEDIQVNETNLSEINLDNSNDLDSYDEISIRSKSFDDNKHSVNQNITKSFEDISKELDIQSVQSENDGTISSPPDSITSYISISIPSSADKSHKLEYLANSLAEKIDEYCESQLKETIHVSPKNEIVKDNCPEVNLHPIYTKVSKKRSFAETKTNPNSKNTIHTKKEFQQNKSDIYVSNTYIDRIENSTEDNLFCASTKNITTEPFVTTLIENQYYSLPDLNISKCLRKSERIDAQLREEDPEDIVCENTYEIAQSHFREILSSKSNQNYGQLITIKPNCCYSSQVNIVQKAPEYSDQHLIPNFTRLEDDLKSIITVNSSNGDELNEITIIDTQQNEREINEIEGTIRNNKLITKSESLRLSSGYRFKENNLYVSVSNDNIHQVNKDKKTKTGIKKHYSLRQREPSDGELDRLPSPATVERTLRKGNEVTTVTIKESINDNNNSLLSRVQSFKTSSEGNIAIIPLSGHQTIIINPPLETEEKHEEEYISDIKPVKQELQSSNLITHRSNNITNLTESTKNKVNSGRLVKSYSVDTSSHHIPKDPFITIKLNKVVKTTIPKLKKETSEKISSVHFKFEKPPTRLIIKDNKGNNSVIKKLTTSNMTRPQVMQVVDSKNTKHTITSDTSNENINQSLNKEILVNTQFINKDENKIEVISVKEKINNAIKTDIEYQEKIHSVKNYWSKLIDKNSEAKLEVKEDSKERMENQKIDNFQINDNFKENKSNAETTVGNIIKSIESVRIVDSIRKISQTKFNLWKDESEKVKSDSEIEETMVQKIVKDCEENISNNSNSLKGDKNDRKTELELCARDTPEIEIVELSSDDNQNQKTQATLIKAKGYNKGCDDFDHVRYKVMKSELFKNSMIANYKKEAQFDGLLQYLQDYSFQELLVNNNIVIIEPVRTKIEPAPRRHINANTCKISPSLLKKDVNNLNQLDKSKNIVRKHFFYHPIRVNKEIIEEELPNPDTVKKVRNLFEDTLKMRSPMVNDPPIIDESTGLKRRAASHRNLNEDSKGTKYGCRKKVIRQLTIDTSFGNKKWDNASLSSGVSSGDLSSNNDYETDGLSPCPQKSIKDHVYSSSSEEYLCDSINHDFCCESQYVSPDILKKIRECGTSITYYGGKVLNSKMGSTVSPMTKAIMDEIQSLQKNCSRDCYLCQTKCRGDKCSCLVADNHKLRQDNKQHSSTSSDSGNQDPDKHLKRNDSFPGFKFKLVKSNSCSSRLELTGTDESKSMRYKYRNMNNRVDDPPLVNDEENSVKNKICRLESYNKGMVNTPFENKDEENKEINKSEFNVLKINKNQVASDEKQTAQEIKCNPIIKNNSLLIDIIPDEKSNDTSSEKNVDSHSFEKKYYYVNDNLEKTKATTGKFGEMVFEEFEVLESCYDSLNSNKSLK